MFLTERVGSGASESQQTFVDAIKRHVDSAKQGYSLAEFSSILFWLENIKRTT